MKENVTFYKCEKCGNLIGLISGNADNISCCGEQMKGLRANTSDGATEKHVPTYEIDGNEIVARVGEVEHPMEQEHFINWMALVSDNRTTRVRFEPGQKPEARFEYIPGSIIYEYCNKHGLWKKEVE